MATREPRHIRRGFAKPLATTLQHLATLFFGISSFNRGGNDQWLYMVVVADENKRSEEKNSKVKLSNQIPSTILRYPTRSAEVDISRKTAPRWSLPISKKQKLAEPPSTKRSKKALSDKKKQQKDRFKPKVMMDSPFTPPKQESKKKQALCRRALDFGSSSTGSEEKEVFVCTRGGFRLGRKVIPVISKHKESDQQKSIVLFSFQLCLQCIEKEEQEWMKSEQVLFRDRALSFISSIRPFQGNRTFTGWKGSVVDSVVGVILTQNTSDKISSSIFMSLAAKYPNRSTIKDPKKDSRTEHALDWNAIRCAHVDEISQVIKGRGQHNRLAKRIQEFLGKIYDEKSGLFNIEWLRNAEPEKATEYFMAVFGLGVKSTECLRLLTLRQVAFPVDTHVSRIMVRLGWVQIGKLPDGFLLHQLEEYPPIERVYEYLSPRISELDAGSLYELHYQMITFGKVFCKKENPNCKSCPLKKDCEHHKSKLLRFAPVTPGRAKDPMKPTLIIEDIEDLCIPKVNPVVMETEELLTGVWNHMSENNMPLKKNAVSKAIVTVSAKKPSHRHQKSKVRSAGRLRTEHQVYIEIKDSTQQSAQIMWQNVYDTCPILRCGTPWYANGPSRSNGSIGSDS
nr:protein ROS1-like [Tanacetum cinerariifolium]